MAALAGVAGPTDGGVAAEAALLDDRRFGEWLALFAEDAHYWMPIRRTMTSNALDQEFTAPGAMAFSMTTA